MAMSTVQAWQETALISISRFPGTTEVHIPTMTDSFSMDEGEYGGEGIPTLAGGRVWKQTPHADGTITIEFYPIELDTTTSNVGLFEQWIGGTYTSSEPRTTDTSWAAGTDRSRDKFRICILWSNDTTPPTSASGATAASTDSLRFTALSCRMISHNADFSDGVLKVTVTFKYPQFNKAGTVRLSRWESGDATALVTQGTYDDADAYT